MYQLYSTVASSLLAASSDQVPTAVESSIPERSIVIASSQFPTGNVGRGPLNQVSGAIIGAMVAAVVVLVVGSVIVAASLIARRVMKTGGKTVTGMYNRLVYICANVEHVLQLHDPLFFVMTLYSIAVFPVQIIMPSSGSII